MILIMVAFMFGLNTHAQDLTPCSDRPHFINHPWVDGTRYCLEEVFHDPQAGELAFTALAASPDGTLYAARPLSGEVVALEDTNSDSLPDSPRVVADGLTQPNGLTYHKSALYISGGTHIYRLVGDTLEILVDNLPAGPGFWTGGLAVGPDERIYVATGAPCDFCVPGDPARGAIISFSLDGSAREIVATGLRQPSDVVFAQGMLWTIDTARDGLVDAPNLDELNRVFPGSHFGFPYCIGLHNQPDFETADFDCRNATPAALTFPTQSTPLGLALYSGDAFPWLNGKLLVVLNGSRNHAEIRGYSVVAVSFDAVGSPSSYIHVIPYIEGAGTITGIMEQDVHYSGAGFWPNRPLDVVTSAEGWVYVNESGGRIFVLRPR
jgi:glucose/arabinose dehydrogenase